MEFSTIVTLAFPTVQSKAHAEQGLNNSRLIAIWPAPMSSPDEIWQQMSRRFTTLYSRIIDQSLRLFLGHVFDSFLWMLDMIANRTNLMVCGDISHLFILYWVL